MGYQRSALKLVWPEDSEFSGLEVRMKRLSVRQLLRIESLRDLRKDGTTSEVEAAFGEMLDLVGKGLLSWNLEDEAGDDVPAVRESLDDLDADMALTLIAAWASAAAAVPLASRKTSPTGEPEPPEDEWASYLATSQEISPEPVSS